jgi:hypothetical protein
MGRFVTVAYRGSVTTGRSSSPKKTGKWIATGIVLLLNIILWAVPSNVAYLVAQNRDVLLGRYSVDRMVVLFSMIPVSILVLYVAWSNEKNKKERQFKVAAMSISVIGSLIVVDLFVRLAQPKRYFVHRSYLHRTPNTLDHGTIRDVPEKAFMYPTNPPAYPDIEYTLTVDKRGFRNKTDLREYNIITIGDSFVEGSNVSDDQTWPLLLAQKSGLTVYNLGMSAGHPGSYLETLKRFGLQLSPGTVLCMLYEGNDFRDSNFRNKNGLGEHLRNYFRDSPVRKAFLQLLIGSFGTAGEEHLENLEPNKADRANSTNPLCLLPVAVPDGPGARYYTFKVKRLSDHFVSKDTFDRSRGFRKTCAALRDIKQICVRNKARLIVVYAPDKPHTLLPLITERVSPQQLHSFMALKESKLPPAKELVGTLLARLEIQESGIEEFCRKESIEFVDLTKALRERISDGGQAYFTYDQHWTPVGHEVVADTLRSYLQVNPTKSGN